MAVMKRCNHAGCKELIPYNQTYCSKHEKKRVYSAKYDEYDNRKRIGGKYFKFYHSKAWQNTSKLFRYNNPLCKDCLESGIYRKADVVDHIVEIRDDFSKRLDWDNLQSLCHDCHNRKTRAERERRMQEPSTTTSK